MTPAEDEPMDRFKFNSEVRQSLKAAGVGPRTFEMGYEDCLKAMRRVTAEQVSKLRTANPEATPDEVRAKVVRGMRTALDMRSDQVEDWLIGKAEAEIEHSQETLTTFLFYSMVDMFRCTFGHNTTNPITQESLMVEIQKALDEALPLV